MGTSPPSLGYWDGAGAAGLGAWGAAGGPGLTGAAEALLADPQQHGAAEVAVGRFLEVLQPPGVLPVVLHVLQGRRAEGEGGSLPRRGSQPATFISFSPRKSPQRVCGSSLPAGPWAPPCSPSPWCSPEHPRCRLPLLPGHVRLLALLAPSSSSPQPLGTARLRGCSAGGRREGDSTSGARPPPPRGDKSKPLTSGSKHERFAGAT